MGSLLLAINLTGQINMAKLDEGRAKNWRVQTSRVNTVTVQTLGIIGVGRFRILGGGGGGGGGGQGLEYWGGAKGGPNSQQAHDVEMTTSCAH